MKTENPITTAAAVAPAMAAEAVESFWGRMDRYGGYVFWSLFLAVGVGAPFAAFIYSLLDHTVLE